MGCKPSSGGVTTLSTNYANATPVNCILTGPPGCGKGTHAEAVRDALGIKWISTGNLLRAEVAAGTDAGKEAEGYMTRGELVPEDLTHRII